MLSHRRPAHNCLQQPIVFTLNSIANTRNKCILHSTSSFPYKTSQTMQQYAYIALTFGALLIILTASASSAPTIPLIVCQQNMMSGEAPPKVRQLCALLEKAIEAAPQEEGEYVEAAPIYDKHMEGRGLKRQDVDHVFLRFGRRPAGI